jgi:hypothetical protein
LYCMQHDIGMPIEETSFTTYLIHHRWNLAECLGSAANAGSNKYYADYNQSKCVKDCTGSDCGGLVGGVWDELYDDKSTCCAEKFWWIEDCDA